MSSELLKFCEPKEYYEQYLLESVYPDGRSITDFRGTSIQVGFNPSARGSAIVQQAGSLLDVSVELSLAVKGEEPKIEFELETPDNMNETVLEEANMILDQLKENKAYVNLDSVTANDDRLMWILKVHIQVLSCDTSFLDALVAAVSAALLDTKIPEIRFAEQIDEDAPLEISKAIITDTAHPLKLADLPLCCGFAVYKTITKKEPDLIILSDPIQEVLQFVVSKCICVVGYEERIHSLLISGGETISIENIKKLHSSAKDRHRTLSIALKKITGRLDD